MYQPRFYRKDIGSDLVNFTIKDKETDILVSAGKNLKSETETLVRKYRAEITAYIKKNPAFETSLKPLPFDGNAPEIIKSMLRASGLAGVGPMAAVAGAISEFAGRGLLKLTGQVILENGGDIFIKTDKARRIGIYAGNSPLSGKIAVKIKPESTPLGICTSSGTVGHSFSFGKADSVSIMARDTVIADACATAACNMVKTERDIEGALNFAKSIESVLGAVIIYKDRLGSMGDIEISRGEIL